jgi:hypothetical protein
MKIFLTLTCAGIGLIGMAHAPMVALSLTSAGAADVARLMYS